jgi:hypothetical protein
MNKQNWAANGGLRMREGASRKEKDQRSQSKHPNLPAFVFRQCDSSHDAPQAKSLKSAGVRE